MYNFPTYYIKYNNDFEETKLRMPIFKEDIIISQEKQKQDKIEKLEENNNNLNHLFMTPTRESSLNSFTNNNDNNKILYKKNSAFSPINKKTFSSIFFKSNKINKRLSKVKTSSFNEINNSSNSIFFIEKCLRKRGRKRKISSIQCKRNKKSLDNLIIKFKVHLMNSICSLLNNSFIEKSRIKFKKINPKEYTFIQRDKNLKWLNLTVKEVFSMNLSNKYKNDEIKKNGNKKLFEEIEKSNKELKIIKIMNKTIKEMWIAFKEDIKNDEFEGFITLNDDINKLKMINGESDDYIENYSKSVKEFELHFQNLRSRARKTKETKGQNLKDIIIK